MISMLASNKGVIQHLNGMIRIPNKILTYTSLLSLYLHSTMLLFKISLLILLIELCDSHKSLVSTQLLVWPLWGMCNARPSFDDFLEASIVCQIHAILVNPSCTVDDSQNTFMHCAHRTCIIELLLQSILWVKAMKFLLYRYQWSLWQQSLNLWAQMIHSVSTINAVVLNIIVYIRHYNPLSIVYVLMYNPYYVINCIITGTSSLALIEGNIVKSIVKLSWVVVLK